MSKHHKRIWLQVGDVDGTTWCQDKINESDIEYVLAGGLTLTEVNRVELVKGQCYVYVDDSGKWQLNEFQGTPGLAGGERRRFVLPDPSQWDDIET